MTLRTIHYSLDITESPLLINSVGIQPGVCDRLTVLQGPETPLPYVPASSVRGLVKDSLRGFLLDNRGTWDQLWLCQGQEVPDPAVDSPFCAPDQDLTYKNVCPLCRIFGAPGGVKRGFRLSGAYYPDQAVSYVKTAFGSANLFAASIMPRTRNRYDDAYRRAREDHLFTDGVAEIMAKLQGTVRETPAHRRFDNHTMEIDYRLLLLSLRLVSRLGASRNRGYGRCEFELADPPDWQEEIGQLTQDWSKALC